MHPWCCRKSCNLTLVSNTSATQDGLTGFYLILPTASISVTRQTAVLFHASVATFTREELSVIHTQYAIQRTNVHCQSTPRQIILDNFSKILRPSHNHTARLLLSIRYKIRTENVYFFYVYYILFIRVIYLFILLLKSSENIISTSWRIIIRFRF